MKVKKNIETLLDTSKVVGLGINIKKAKYMLLSQQTPGQYHDTKIEERLFGNVSQFRYLGMTVTNQISLMRKLRED
jgi:hypothetical protein